MKIIGVTGGIGSGKSTVCKFVSSDFSVEIIDADILAKKQYDSEVIQKKILSVFPEMKSFDISELSKNVFENQETINKLTRIIYPELLKDIQEIISEQKTIGQVSAVLIDAALIIESNFHSYLQKNYQYKLVLVESNEQERIKRVFKKNNLSIEEIQQRMKLQLSDTEKSQYADYLISNSGNIEQLRVQTLNVFQDILSH